MKWPFLKRSVDEKNRCQSADVKRKRKRHTKSQLVNLLCTLKQRTISNDLSLSDFLPTLEQLPNGLYCNNFIQPTVPWSSLPIQHLKAPKRSIETRDSPSAFCPTCHQVMILLPQKPCAQIGESNSSELRIAKRMRPSPISYKWEPIETTLSGHLNPTYEDCMQTGRSRGSREDDSLYSEVASSTLSSTNSSVDDISARPKLVGVRRRDLSFKEMNRFTVSSWIIDRSPTSDLAQSEPIYATVLPDYELSDDSTASDSLFFEQPWSCSTLKNSEKATDLQTIYDPVASDDEDEDRHELHAFQFIDKSCTRGNVGRSTTGIASCRRRQFSGNGLDYHVKRTRREYYICEE